MADFKNVTVSTAANIYFNGMVTSRTITFADGAIKTLGIMQPGEYEFKTDDKELMQIISGELEVLLPTQTGWKKVIGGECFEVPANDKFNLKIKTVTDYCCSYIK